MAVWSSLTVTEPACTTGASLTASTLTVSDSVVVVLCPESGSVAVTLT